MKKQDLIKIALSLAIIFAMPVTVVNAQSSSVDDNRIQQRLEEEGLDKAPEVIEVEKSQMQGQAPSSGFVDENGKPLSDAEYAERQKNQKGLFRKYPWILPVVLIGLGGVAFAIIKTRKK